MKRFSLLLMALGMVACGAPNESPLLLTDAVPYDTTTSCDGRGTASFSQTRGTLDISSTRRYLMTFTISNKLATPTVIVEGKNLASGEGATIVSDQIELTYTSTPPLNFEDELRPQYAVIQPSTDGWLGMNLIGPKAYLTLLGSVGAGQSVDLQVGIRILGSTIGGTQVTSNRIVFPIQVYNSGFTGCASGVRKVVDGPCGNSGQDGSIVGCCSDSLYAGNSSCTG